MSKKLIFSSAVCPHICSGKLLALEIKQGLRPLICLYDALSEILKRGPVQAVAAQSVEGTHIQRCVREN
jgi:hypothetical protein